MSANVGLLLFTILFTETQSVYYKQTPNHPAALCLDGSPAVIFVSQGDPNKLMIHFESGGWCGDKDLSTTIQNCYNRSMTNMGSSRYLENSISFESESILGDSTNNYYRNWTRIFFNYCDGSGHQGTRLDPVQYKGKLLYFRGTNITTSRFDYLQEHYGLYTRSEEVIISGSSAGGLSTLFWADYLGERLVKAKYWALPCSGVFLDSPDMITGEYKYRNSLINLMKLSNVEISMPVTACFQKYPEEPYRCYFAQYLIPVIKTPMFLVQSLYDYWSIPNILGLSCSIRTYSLTNCQANQLAYISIYAKNTTQVIESALSNSKNAIWGNGCVFHGYIFFYSYTSGAFRIPAYSEWSVNRAFYEWQSGQSNSTEYLDRDPWPSNKPCSNSNSFIGK